MKMCDCGTGGCTFDSMGIAQAIDDNTDSVCKELRGLRRQGQIQAKLLKEIIELVEQQPDTLIHQGMRSLSDQIGELTEAVKDLRDKQ